MSRKHYIFILFLCIFANALAYSQSPDQPLTNIDIVSMVQDRTSISIIRAKIKSSPNNFDTSPNAIQQLKRLGVTEAIVLLMIEHGGRITAAGQSSNAGPSQTNSQTQPPPQSVSNLGPKRKGIPRIGIVTTTTTAPLEQDEAVRSQFYEVLFGNRETSSTEAILMKEKLDRNIASEAAFTKSDYLLYISLDSTIESAAKNRGNFLQKGLKAGAEALGAASKLANPLTILTGITYRSHQMADSLGTSTALLETITNATKKNDRIGINFRLINVRTGETVIAQTLKEIVAQKKKEPILQNLLIQLGNEIVNVIPSTTRL